MNLVDTKTSKELYEFLLDEIHEKNIMIFGEENIKVPSPNIYFDVTRKTVWKNFMEYPKFFNRDTNHFIQFVNKELKITTSINGENYLLINGRIKINQIKTIIANYINNYVRCVACKTINTEIIKNTTVRLDFIKCKTCKVESVIKK